MGTPIPSREREMAVRNCIDPNKVEKRQLTPEERAYYDSISKPSKRINAFNYGDITLFSEERIGEAEMKGIKIPIPPKEDLAEMCKKYPSKTKAAFEIAKEKGTSHSVVFKWMKHYGIDEFGTSQNVAPKKEEYQKAEKESEKKPLEVLLALLEGCKIGEIYKRNGIMISIQYDNLEVAFTDEITLKGGCIPFDLVEMVTNLIERQEK